MKKKILLFIASFIFTCSSVFASSALPKSAIAPKVLPEEGADVYAATDNGYYNYNRISFTSSNSSESDIAGLGSNRIFLTVNPTYTNIYSFETTLGENRFSAYKLNSKLETPFFNTVSYWSNTKIDNNNDEDKLGIAALAIMYNNKTLYSKFKKAIGYNYFVGSGVTYTLVDHASATDALDDLYDLKNVKINIQKIEYISDKSGSGITQTITAEDLSGIPGTTNFEVTITPTDLALSRFSATPNETTTTNYDKALWIADNSYPVITMEELYKNAGTTYFKTFTDLLNGYYDDKNGLTYDETVTYLNTSTTNSKGENVTNLENEAEMYERLYKCANNTLGDNATTEKGYLLTDLKKYYDKEDINNYFTTSTLTGDELTITTDDITQEGCKSLFDDEAWWAKIEMYTYDTIQHAIWKVSNGYTTDTGSTLGDTLKGSTELNKLYQYLIKDREEANGYATRTFTNTLTLNKPDSSKEIYKDETDYYIYGPYTSSSDVLSVDSISIIFDGNSTGASIVDKDGNAISEVKLGEEFYIKCNKTDKVTNLKIKLTGKNAISFSKTSNRSKVYYSNSPIVTDVVTPGIKESVTLENTFDITFNPKTGYANLVVIFSLGIILFAIGYVAVSTKNNKVNL